MSRKSKEIPFQECNLFQEVASCPCNITLPLAGMCGGGFSGSPGGVTATLLSVFCFVSFLWALGEELEVLLELVTVSPELHETVGFSYRCNWCFLQPDIYIWEARTRNFGYYNSWQLINCRLLKKNSQLIVFVFVLTVPAFWTLDQKVAGCGEEKKTFICYWLKL